MSNNRSVRIFMMPQQSSCCGPPVGQTEEETQSLKSTIEKETGCQVAVSNLFNGGDLTDYPQIVRILNSFGTGALPIIALDGEVVSLGNPTPEQAVLAIKEKINQI
jgi:hypothetical protein